MLHQGEFFYTIRAKHLTSGLNSLCHQYPQLGQGLQECTYESKVDPELTSRCLQYRWGNQVGMEERRDRRDQASGMKTEAEGRKGSAYCQQEKASSFCERCPSWPGPVDRTGSVLITLLFIWAQPVYLSIWHNLQVGALRMWVGGCEAHMTEKCHQ